MEWWAFEAYRCQCTTDTARRQTLPRASRCISVFAHRRVPLEDDDRERRDSPNRYDVLLDRTQNPLGRFPLQNVNGYLGLVERDTHQVVG